MKLSVIIPAYNECATVARIIQEVQDKNPRLLLELIVVDDGSTDGTWEFLQALQSNHVKILRHPENRGKGAAIRTALEAATGTSIIIQDADLEYDPADFPRLLEPLLNGQAQVVYGSRVLQPGNPIAGPMFYLGGLFLSWLTRLLYRCQITDEPTCYKLFDAALLKSIPLQCMRFEFCPEVTAKILKRGVKIVEVPIRYSPRDKKAGKKICWRDGVQAIWTLVKYRFSD